MKNFSILNPKGRDPKSMGINRLQFSNTFSGLEISRILRIESIHAGGKMTTSNLADFIALDEETILHRLDIFEDLLNCDGLIDFLRDVILPGVQGLSTMRTSSDEEGVNFVDQFQSVKQLNTYVQFIEKSHESLAKLDFKSEGLHNFAKKVATIYNSEDYENIKVNLPKLIVNIESDIKSVTVGVNLDDSMNIINMGIVSLNEERYKPNKLIDKLIRPGFTHNDKYRLITPLQPVYSAIAGMDIIHKYEMNRSFNNSINKLLKGSVKSMPKEISEYMKSQTQFLVDLASEICFLVAGYGMIIKLKNNNMPVCKPTVSQNRVTHMENLYHPALLDTTMPEDIVLNSVSFDDNGMLYILTGANSGGKSVFMHSVGIAQVLFQLGLYVPADKAVMLPVDHVCLHLPSDSAVSNVTGRLEYECKALNEIIKTVTSKSLVLIDEVFSSTSAHDGSVLTEELLKYFAKTGCKGIFSTHIHGLSAPRINEMTTGVKVDTLVAVVDEGKRTYRVSRQEPEGLSHARDIAIKYGLLVDIDE